MDVRDVLSFSSPSPSLRRSLKPPIPPDVDSDLSESKKPRFGHEFAVPTSQNVQDVSFTNDNEVPHAGNLTSYDDEDDEPGVPTTVGADEVDDSTIRRLSSLLEKRILANQEARTKFPDQPKRFMQSEVELQETLEEMQILAANPDLYPQLAEQTRSISLLLSLLAHDNTDISLSVIDLLHELLEVNGLNEAGPDRVDPLLDLLFRGQLIQMLMQNVARLDETQTDEAEGVHKTLGIVESLLDFRPAMNETIANQGLFSWLLRRIQRRPIFDRNKLYVSEILSILLQLDEANRRHLGEIDGIDILLQQLAVYKRLDPTTREEVELMHNLFDCLCSALMLPENKDRFLKGEGIQLMNLMLREKHMSRDSALRVLDFALCLVSNASNPPTPLKETSNSDMDATDSDVPKPAPMDGLAVIVANCAKFVEVLGLRTIFPLFMHSPRERVQLPGAVPKSNSVNHKNQSLGGPTADEMEEHIINIIHSLLRHCPPPMKSRVVSKFVENDHEKLDRLIELHMKYFDRVKAIDKRLKSWREDSERWVGMSPEEIDNTLMFERLGGGLLALQMLDVIVLDVCVNGASTVLERVLQLLKMRSISPNVILRVVQDHLDDLGDGDSVGQNSEKIRLQELMRSFSARLT